MSLFPISKCHDDPKQPNFNLSPLYCIIPFFAQLYTFPYHPTPSHSPKISIFQQIEPQLFLASLDISVVLTVFLDKNFCEPEMTYLLSWALSGLKVGPLCSRSDQKSFRSEISRSICLQSVPPAFSKNLQSLVRRRRRRRCVYCGGGATLTLPTLCQSHVLNCPPPTLLPKYFLKYLPTFWYFSFLLVLFGFWGLFWFLLVQFCGIFSKLLVVHPLSVKWHHLYCI